MWRSVAWCGVVWFGGVWCEVVLKCIGMKYGVVLRFLRPVGMWWPVGGSDCRAHTSCCVLCNYSIRNFEYLNLKGNLR